MLSDIKLSELNKKNLPQQQSELTVALSDATKHEIVKLLHTILENNYIDLYWSLRAALDNKYVQNSAELKEILAATFNGETLLHRAAKRFAHRPRDADFISAVEKICEELLNIPDVNPFIRKQERYIKIMAIDHVFRFILNHPYENNFLILQHFLDQYLGIGLNWSNFPASKIRTKNLLMKGFIESSTPMKQDHIKTIEDLAELAQDRQILLAIRLEQFLYTLEPEKSEQPELYNELVEYIDKLTNILKDQYPRFKPAKIEDHRTLTTEPIDEDIGDIEIDFSDSEPKTPPIAVEKKSSECEIQIVEVITQQPLLLNQQEFNESRLAVSDRLKDTGVRIINDRYLVNTITRHIVNPDSSKFVISYIFLTTLFVVFNIFMVVLAYFLEPSRGPVNLCDDPNYANFDPSNPNCYAVLNSHQKLIMNRTWLAVDGTIIGVTAILILIHLGANLLKNKFSKEEHALFIKLTGLDLPKLRDNFPHLEQSFAQIIRADNSFDAERMLNILSTDMKKERFLAEQTVGRFFPLPPTLLLRPSIKRPVRANDLTFVPDPVNNDSTTMVTSTNTVSDIKIDLSSESELLDDADSTEKTPLIFR